GGRLRGEPVGELIIAAVLEEAPHRPDVAPVAAAELQVVRPALPAQRVAPLDDRVPGVHGRGREGVTHPGIALHVEPRRAECALAAEADPLNPEFRNDVVALAVLR